ncbi:short chain dehydrogenase [Vibrio sp. 99-8-1]|uniref:short chain dehydrogenase n=1 Tax=Vibrio sp. 99-8-1 TaxID=2607602 RepID=UPI0014936E6A|nr:short chain dehydrogenase [Vibrio sp. 99-8-1]NOI65102.1 short chain dehydrogenase [Vibrio sp. 99-8-1]
MKKVLILGATGLIGSAVSQLLEGSAEVVKASFNHPENPVDIANPESLKALFAKVGKVDGIVCVAGMADFIPWEQADDAKWQFGIENKMMGQINTIRYGEEYVNDGGAIVLSTGVLAQYPFPGSGILTTVNAAVEAAIKASVTEIERVRINAVSPGWVAETMVAMGMDPEPGLPAKEVAQYFVDLVEESTSGDIVVAAK